MLTYIRHSLLGSVSVSQSVTCIARRTRTRHMSEHNSTAIVRQKNLKEQLRRALDENDEVSCWARIERSSDDGQISQGIMKLLAVNSRFYSFMSYSQRVTDHKADNWLLHEDEFYVHWVGRGHNLGGAMITGEELETDFFMYQTNGTYDSDSDDGEEGIGR